MKMTRKEVGALRHVGDWLRTLWNWLLDVLFPRKCLLCESLLLPSETDLCDDCRTHAPCFTGSRRSIPLVADWTSVWFYEGNARESILRYKFGGEGSYAQGYGRLLAMAILNAGMEFDVLTWVPVSFFRRWRRGYDQVELLAKAVAGELGCEAERTLWKSRHNRRQSSITGPERRRANVLGAFQARRPERVAEKRVLLLDDILTTGATAEECAKVLRLAGAERVYVGTMAVARGKATGRPQS